MTHATAIRTLLALVEDGPRPDAGVRQAAEEHVAACSECWKALERLTAIATGSPPPDAAHMAGLYGCEGVRDGLFAMVGLDARTRATRDPVLARHLTWCVPCREELVELEAIERLAATDTPARVARWERLGGVGGAVREAVGRLAARVGDVVAGFAAAPDGFVLGPAVAAAAVRGAAPGGEAQLGLHRSVRVDLAESGLAAELSLEPDGGGLARLVVRVEGDDTGALSIDVRESRGDALLLLARRALGPDTEAVVAGLPSGSYLVDVHQQRESRRFRLHLDIQPCA